MKNVTCSQNLVHDGWKFELFDLYTDKMKPLQKPCLSFFTEERGQGEIIWDNEKWLKKFFKELKFARKGKKISALKNLCKDYDWDFEDMRIDLLEAYKLSKKLKMWK